MNQPRVLQITEVNSAMITVEKRNFWLVFLEVIASCSLVAGLFYVAFFVKLSSEVPNIEPSAFGNRDNYFDIVSVENNSDILWAVGRGGKVIRSDDRGRNWQIQNVPVQSHLQSIALWDENTAIVIGDHGVALLTENAGGHWRQLKLPIREFGEQLLNVITSGDQEAWLVGRMGTVMHSTDRGHTWVMRHPEEDVSFNNISINPDGSVWLVGEFGKIKKSIDNGLHWQEIDSQTNNSLMGIAFANEKVGVAAGLSGTLLSTLDGGQNWQTQSLSIDSHFYNVAWLGEQFATVGNGSVLLTGKPDQWNLQVLNNAGRWYTSIIADADSIYLSGSNIIRIQDNKIQQFSNASKP